MFFVGVEGWAIERRWAGHIVIMSDAKTSQWNGVQIIVSTLWVVF